MVFNKIIQDFLLNNEIIKSLFPYSYIPIEPKDENTVYVLGNEVKFYIAYTLSEAWEKAYPQYSEKFANDLDFKNFVDSANGKWLEPKYGTTHYCVLLSTKCSKTAELEEIFSHELRHCYDFLKSLEHYNFDGLPSFEEEFSNWTEFNAVYTATIHHFINADISSNSKYDAFKLLSSYLGWKTADEIHGIRTKGNEQYRIARYLGLQRAIRDLSHEFSPSPSFQLWHLTPLTIEEHMENSFYLSNKYQEMEYFHF